ncbi:hypothetical protein [Butyrivibrio sp. WCD3002]|uniref:hypothetical protein n=1 Tax=Butyrivibrio sp. WCD3002 TaxID=1280676 RepID=UPI0004226D10|nr:hypothetical protein [Butyrivibrio sp. WCD3002]
MSDHLIKFNKHHKKKKSRNNKPFPLLQIIFLCFIFWGLIYAFNNIWSKTPDDEYIPFEVSKGLNDIKISGSAITIPPSDDDQLSHAWNAVKISEKWYEVDTTWDDQEYDEGEYDEFYALLSSYEDEYDNLIHHYYNRTTAEMENLKATDDTLFHIDGYEPYNAVNDSAHVRDAASSANSNSITVFVNSLIPVSQ